VIPHSRSGLVAGVLIGLGRALGETIAVALVIGSSPQITAKLFSSGDALAAVIANQFGETTAGSDYQAALIGMAVVLFAANAWVAFIGFALVGAGLAPVAPILFNAATRVPGVSRAAAIASVTSIGYSGFMIGPPLIGGIASATSLTAALFVLVVAAGLLAYGARYVPQKPI